MAGLKLSSAFGSWLFRFLDDDGLGFICASCFGFVGSRVDFLFFVSRLSFITDGFKVLLDETVFACLGFWNRNIELECQHRSSRCRQLDCDRVLWVSEHLFERLDTSCIYVLLDCNYVIFFVTGIYANDIKEPVLEGLHLEFG